MNVTLAIIVITSGKRDTMRRIFILFMLFMLISACSNVGEDEKQTLDEDKSAESTQEVDTTFNKDELQAITNESFLLSEEKLQNLFVLGKVWGYLKYYHPNVANGVYDWDQQLFDNIPNIMNASSSHDRDAALTDWISSLGDFKQGTAEPPQNVAIMTSVDLEWISDLQLSDELASMLTDVKEAKRENTSHYATLNPDAMRVAFQNEKNVWDSYPSTENRLLALYRYWNMIEYFSPFKHLIDEDWDNVLQSFIPKMIKAEDELTYKLAILELIATLNDTHASYAGDAVIEKFWGLRYASVILSIIEDKAVVTGYYNEELGKKSGLMIGDIINKVNNKTVEEIRSEKMKYISGSNETARLLDLSQKLLRSNEDSIMIEYERNGNIGTTEIAVYSKAQAGVEKYDPYRQNIDFYQKMNDNIVYLYPASPGTHDLTVIKSDLMNSKGIIIDLRSYPAYATLQALAELLISPDTPAFQRSIASVEQPGTFYIDGFDTPAVANEYYKGKVVLLVNEISWSRAEYAALVLSAAPNATVIGSTTAGSPGDTSQIILPGNVSTLITGVAYMHPDGTETQGAGIVPDLYVTPTIEGIRANRDEVLEKAIDFLASSQ